MNLRRKKVLVKGSGGARRILTAPSGYPLRASNDTHKLRIMIQLLPTFFIPEKCFQQSLILSKSGSIPDLLEVTRRIRLSMLEYQLDVVPLVVIWDH
jgi:hypothetical protein